MFRRGRLVGAGVLAPAFLYSFVHVPVQAAAAPRTYYVSPSGDDGGPGTEARPFKTVDKARDAVRPHVSAMDADITIVLRGGVYALDQTLAFDGRDSGRHGHQIIYKAQSGETPVLSGGRRITGWTPDSANRWKASTDIPDFRQLYVNGRRAVRARGGELPGAELHGADGYKTTLAAMADWRNPGDMEFCYLVVWAHTRCKVREIRKDGAGAVVTMLQPWFGLARYKEGVRVELPSYVENAFELLDEPGEWYLDRAAHVVYYIPRPGEDLRTAEVIVPVLEKLVGLQGTLDHPVHDIRFEGITFAYADWLGPSRIGHVDLQANFTLAPENKLERDKRITMIHNEALKSPANVVCRAARSVRFEKCTFTRLGGAGIDIERGSQENAISGCEFSDISGSAIQVGDVLRDDHHPKDARLTVKNNSVTSNYIHDVALDYKGGVGVCVGYTDGTTIAHNEICNLPYSGVSVGWGWGEEDAGGGAPNYYQPFKYDTPTASRNNRIEFNHIHHVMMEMQDGGGIYTLSNMPGTIIRGNHIHDNPGVPGGIYLDEGSGFIEITGNLVYGVQTAMNYNNRVQDRIKTCNEHDNHFDAMPGAFSRTEGRIGKALLCDGAGSFFETAHTAALEPLEMTVEAWVRLPEFPSGDDTRRWIVNKNTHEFTESHYALMIDGRKVGAYLNIGGGQANCFEAWSADVLTLNQWHHLAMTYDGSVLRVYFNGREIASTAVNKKRVPGSTSLRIGRRQDGFLCLKGLIDEVHLYGRALSAGEIKADRDALAADPPNPQNATQKGIVAHWSFDEPVKVPQALKDLVDKAGLEPAYRRR